MLALCAVLTVNAVQLQRTSTVTALDVSQGQSIVFSSGRSCAVVDCGGRSTAEDPGDLAARKLLAQGHRSLDLLVLTHPHDDHVNGVLRLMHWLPVRTLVIPAAADITQAPLSDILALAEANHTTVGARGRATDDRGRRHLRAPVSGALRRTGGRQHDRAGLHRRL